MKTVILSGGLGTRLSEETDLRPKPMVEIGGKPMLWHIMKYYAHYGYNEFALALGYKADFIKKYFLDYATHSGNLTIKITQGISQVIQKEQEEWTIHLEDTGLHTATGSRIKKLQPILGNEPFLLTYGDGLSNIDLNALVAHHKKMNTLATITGIRPPARFGWMDIENNRVKRFKEKEKVSEGWVNGGFMVMEPGVFDLIQGENCSLEFDVLNILAEKNQLSVFKHDQFWHCMDNIRDVRALEEMWATSTPPWRVWA